ncbi:hypothetical protein FCH83_07335 [Pseudomonas putida]|nr:hypothetical protein [Pseudomonas putida]NTZ01193.1 hypothetical protein [Pseudomonas putida]NTZ22458.1 hypothetical protein [Pseudomonas putida]NTZ55276.1 hypothetical protein [Pseudomonas putida]NTZ64910.1 hypothetical protein [Pseudomonas putida]
MSSLLKAAPEEKRSAFYGVKRDCGREKHDGGMIGDHLPNYLTLESVSELETHVVADCFGAAVTICVFWEGIHASSHHSCNVAHRCRVPLGACGVWCNHPRLLPVVCD